MWARNVVEFGKNFPHWSQISFSPLPPVCLPICDFNSDSRGKLAEHSLQLYSFNSSLCTTRTCDLRSAFNLYDCVQYSQSKMRSVCFRLCLRKLCSVQKHFVHDGYEHSNMTRFVVCVLMCRHKSKYSSISFLQMWHSNFLGSVSKWVRWCLSRPLWLAYAASQLLNLHL